MGAVAEKVGAAGKIFHIFLSLIFFLKKAKLATYYEQWGKIFHFKHPMQQQHFESLAIYDEYKAKNDPKGEFYFPAQHIILSCPAGKKRGLDMELLLNVIWHLSGMLLVKVFFDINTLKP